MPTAGLDTEQLTAGRAVAAAPRRIAVIASASGNGKTTLARDLAEVLAVPFVELDALVHGPDWTETPDAELQALLAPVLTGERWVIDGHYTRKLGTSVLDAADLIVWLDLPIRVWLPRLLVRSWRRWSGHEQLWNGNREALMGMFGGRGSLFGYALRMQHRKRREFRQMLATHNVRWLRTVADVHRFRKEMGLE